MVDRVIYMMRHGVTRSNIEKVYAGWSDEELIEEGISQADRLGKEIQGWGIKTIYTSPIKRAVQTAQILNRYLKGEIVVEPDLTEMKMGPWEGLSETEVAIKYPSEYKVWLERPGELRLEGRETVYEVQQRALRVINKILEMHPDNVSLIVTHVVIVRCIFLFFNHLPLNSYKTIDVPNISIHKLIFDKQRVKMERVR